jgi:hypothetical protein
MIKMSRSLGKKDLERSSAAWNLEILGRYQVGKSGTDRLELLASNERKDLNNDLKRARYECGLRRVLGIGERSCDLEG